MWERKNYYFEYQVFEYSTKYKVIAKSFDYYLGLAEINHIKFKIIELSKYDKYCKEITKRAEGIQKNLNNFDKDIQKEKDNSRSI